MILDSFLKRVIKALGKVLQMPIAENSNNLTTAVNVSCSKILVINKLMNVEQMTTIVT